MSHLTYYDGLREGVRRYAWWKDGIQYVGTTGRTLIKALADIILEETHYYQEQSKLLEKRLDEISKMKTF